MELEENIAVKLVLFINSTTVHHLNYIVIK